MDVLWFPSRQNLICSVHDETVLDEATSALDIRLPKRVSRKALDRLGNERAVLMVIANVVKLRLGPRVIPTLYHRFGVSAIILFLSVQSKT